MAHQTAHIPWNILASNLLWSEAKHPGNGDLHLRFQPDQGKQLEYFVEALVRNIGEHSSTSRKKYPEHYDPPHPDDIILDDATASKIAPTVRRWCASGEMREYVQDRCRGDDSAAAEKGQAKPNLNDVIPDEERRAAAFYRSYRGNDCFYFFRENGEAFFNLEVVKTLLLYGEMDIIFRVCANPDVDLGTWWSIGTCYCGPADAGWDMLCTTALLPYICLNVIHCFPETWDPASGRTDNKDYRRMRIYQYMLKQCTMADLTSEVAALPHRRFFGIADDQFLSFTASGLPNQNSIHPYGVMSFDKFLTCDNPRIVPAPAPADVPVVRQILRSRGLPMELVLDIMELAEYEPRGRLQVPNDPFHPANREELGKYLKYCWQVLVRCDMMGAAIGMAIPWREVVSDVMVRLFTCALNRGPRKLYGRDSEGGTDACKFL